MINIKRYKVTIVKRKHIKKYQVTQTQEINKNKSYDTKIEEFEKLSAFTEVTIVDSKRYKVTKV